MRVLLAPDKFKGTLDAPQAVEAMSRGVIRAGGSPVGLPMSDGGDGFLDVMLHHLPGRRVRRGADADGRSFEVGVLDGGETLVEVAATDGLSPRTLADPLGVDSSGVGGCLVGSDSLRVVVGIGGTGCTDGGTGAARAAGWRFLDRRGRDLNAGGGGLVDLHRIERDDAPRDLPLDIEGWCDVAVPLLGPTGAARAFGPQKGASPEQVQHLERGLRRLAERIEDQLGLSVTEVPGAGAGGGLGAGLVAFFGASLRRGAEAVAEVADLAKALDGIDHVMTGEGRLDRGSFRGKVVGHIVTQAGSRGLRCTAIVGADGGGEQMPGLRVISLTEAFGERALEDPAGCLEEATAASLTV